VRVRDAGLGETWLRVAGDDVLLEERPALSPVRVWRFPRSGVAVVDLTRSRDPLRPVDASLFADGVRLPTVTGPLRLPNFGLLLAEPYAGGPGAEYAVGQPARRRHDGRPAGYWIDGVLVAVDAPAVATAAFADAGVQVVTDPAFWLAARRPASDPAVLAHRAAGRERQKQWRRSSRLAMLAGLLLASAGAGPARWLVPVGAAVAAVGAVRAR
jgi:hypothetical protein